MISHLNYVHILVAALVYFIIGALWYSVIFGKQWMKLVGIKEVTEQDKKNIPMMFGTTFVLNFIITFAIACIIYSLHPPTGLGAVKIGVLLGVGFVGTTTAMNNMYAMRSFKLTVIDSGYHIFSIIVAAIILQMWH